MKCSNFKSTSLVGRSQIRKIVNIFGSAYGYFQRIYENIYSILNIYALRIWLKSAMRMSK